MNGEAARRESKGLGRLWVGAVLGLAAAGAAIVFPLAVLELVGHNPAGLFGFASGGLPYIGGSLLAGSGLLLLSLMFYRSAFSVLRPIDARFAAVGVLCWLATAGLVVLISGTVLLLGSYGPLVSCAQGAPSQALSCIQALTPLGAYMALAGFWLGWLGSVGVVLGLAIAGARFRSGGLVAGGVVYALTLVVLALPWVNLLGRVPALSYVLVAGPVLALVGPLLVLAGARSSRPPSVAPNPSGTPVANPK